MQKLKILGRFATFHKNRKGFTLIEALIVLFIFSLITVSFYSIFSVGVKIINDAKNRLGAIAVANEKMEIIRNLAYDDIGIENGAPSGDILEDEDVTESSRVYHIHTDVIYRDDDLDGNYPADTIPGDYKKVVIGVSWSGSDDETKKVEFSSRFVPPGLEVSNSGDGILSINVFSDQPGGTGIADSQVRVVNASTGLNTTTETDSSGNVVLIGENIADSIQEYEITLTKAGYETVNTMPPYPETAYSPIDVHASVVTGSLNVVNIVQNQLATLKISTSDYLGDPIENISFDIYGGRRLGYEVVDNIVTSTPVYNLDSSTSTGSDGEKDFGSVSPGEYFVTLPSSVTDSYEVIGEYPIDPFNLFSGNNTDYEVKLASKSVTSLMVKVLDDDIISMPVSGAQVKVTNSLGYDVTQTTGDDGIVFFPVTSDIFQSGDYSISISASGFSDNTSSVTVTANQLKIESVILTSS